MKEGRLATVAKNKIVELREFFVLADFPMLLASCLQNFVVYNDLSHPVATNISNKYAWRTADGSWNNPDLPDMGRVRCLCKWYGWSGADLLIGRTSLFSISSADTSPSCWPASRSRFSLWYVRVDQIFKILFRLADVNPVFCDVMKLVSFFWVLKV